MENRVFLGNPGVGKSTLVNCIFGYPVFESGLSFGAGMAVLARESPALDGVVYRDSPGLADVASREKAAEEIQMVLRHGGKYKIFFVATLRNGRVSAEDVTTFNEVLRAINIPNFQFSIVINNIKPRQYKALQDEENFKKVATALNTMIATTTSITLVPELEGLDEKDNAHVPPPASFLAFLRDAPSITIPPECVRDIDLTQYTRELAELSSVLTKIQEDNDALRKKIHELEKRKPGFRESLSSAFNAFTREIDAWF